VAVARLLLEHGAEVDALADTYGGGPDQTTLNLLVSSGHPAEAGLQPALVEALIDFGAAIEGLGNDGSPLLTALAFARRPAAETLVRLGARVDHVVCAAALGRIDLVRELAVNAHTLRAGVRLDAPRSLRMPSDARGQLELALVWAARFGRTDVVELLLERGVSIEARDGQRMTALHWAAANGSLDVIRVLLARGAPLESRSSWDATPLSTAVFCARGGGRADRYAHPPGAEPSFPAVLEVLLSAGADVGSVANMPTGDAVIDEVLGRYRA
jgi:hypothetical protein